MEPAYVRALNQGKAVHAYENEIRIQNQGVNKMHADLDAMDRDIADMEAELVSDGVSPRRRKALLEEIRVREEDRRLLLDDLSSAEHGVEEMQHNLERMKVRNPYR